jgi:hypothetical protein
MVTEPGRLIGWGVFGMLAGSMVPLWDQTTTGKGVLLVVLLAATLITGLFAGLEALIQRLRGRRSRWPIVPRATLWALLPFDAGVLIGAAAAFTARVGSDQLATDAFIALWALGGGLLALAAVAYVGARGVNRWRDGALGWTAAAAFLAVSVGMLGVGVGFIALSPRLLRGDDVGLGPEGVPLLGGLACFIVGCAVAGVGGRRQQL